MMRFFCNVASLINDVMKPQVSSWVKSIDATSNLVLSGVKLSGKRAFVPIQTQSSNQHHIVIQPDWTQHAMYSQMMGPLKVSMLAEQISGMYLHVSDLYIMPAQRFVFPSPFRWGCCLLTVRDGAQ